MQDNIRKRKSILITGCSSGIGYATARHLSQRGWDVFAACRRAEDCERLRSEGFRSLILDYDKEVTIERAVDDVLNQTDGELYAVFNNGAYAIPGAVEDLSTDALRAIFQSNLFGWHKLTTLAIPVMRERGEGRIIQCSSVLGFAALKMRGSYQATKFALEGLTDTLRLELRGSNIHVVLIEPGPITTKFRENAYARFCEWIDVEKSFWRGVYKDRLIPRLEDLQRKDKYELDADSVAAKVLCALESHKPLVRYPVTFPTYFLRLAKRVCTNKQFDSICSKVSE